MGGLGGVSPRPPLSLVPSPGTQSQPGGQPQPLPMPSRGRRRQSPSGQGRDPGRPSQVSVRDEGEAERTGPGSLSRRIGAGEPGQGLGAHRGAHAPRVLLPHRGSGHCAPSPRLQAAPTASPANPQTELPAFPGGRKLAPKRRRIRALSARDWEAERCGPGPGGREGGAWGMCMRGGLSRRPTRAGRERKVQRAAELLSQGAGSPGRAVCPTACRSASVSQFPRVVRRLQSPPSGAWLCSGRKGNVSA